MTWTVKTKRRCTYFTICLYHYLCGAEYAFIFPILWGFISEKFAGGLYKLGLVISAYSLAGLFINPLIGMWADNCSNPRKIILLTNLFQISGSLFYFMGLSWWFLLLSRFMSGIGVGGIAAILGDIAVSTPYTRLSSTLTFVNTFRHIGLLTGPLFNLLLTNTDFKIGPFVVDRYTAPGLVMAALWIGLELTFAFLYFNLHQLEKEDSLTQLIVDYDASSENDQFYETLDNSNTLSSNSKFRSLTMSASAPALLDLVKEKSLSQSSSEILDLPNIDMFDRNKLEKNQNLSYSSNYLLEKAEMVITFPTADHSNLPSCCSSAKREVIDSISHPYQNSSLVSTCTSLIHRKMTFKEEYLRDEMVIILMISFAISFDVSAIETCMTPLMEEFFQFKEKENSIAFFLYGFELVLLHSLYIFICKKVSDRIMLLGAFFAILFIKSLQAFFIPIVDPSKPQLFYLFFGSLSLYILFVPILFICTSSLISMVTSKDNQALSHGIRRSMINLGNIIGPLWGGPMVEHKLFLYLGPLVVFALVTVLYLLSYNRLKLNSFENISGRKRSAVTHSTTHNSSSNSERVVFASH